jgi:hypothetical protein
VDSFLASDVHEAKKRAFCDDSINFPALYLFAPQPGYSAEAGHGDGQLVFLRFAHSKFEMSKPDVNVSRSKIIGYAGACAF